MFGYVRPLKAELRVADYEIYQAAYCGLCRCLAKRHGFSARFLVSFDMTFLYLLLSGEETQFSVARCHCPARCGGKKACLQEDAAMSYTADATIILGYWKLVDAAADARGLRRFGAGLLKRFFARRYRRAARNWPDLAKTAEKTMGELAALEQDNCPSIDRTADCFARLTAANAAWFPAAEQNRPAYQLLYHVGRYIYLVDALDDLAGDCEKTRYNPLRFRFHPEHGALPADELQELVQTIDRSIDLAAAALELLTLHRSAAFLHNTIYQGLPAVLHAVRDGKFQNKEYRRKL